MTMRKIKDRVCAHCDSTYTPSFSGQKYCGKVCAHIARYGSPPGPPLKGRICEICEVLFNATYTEQRTCSRPCGWELRLRDGKVRLNAEGGRGRLLRASPKRKARLREPVNKACKICGETFPTTIARKQWCSNACYRIAYYGPPRVRTQRPCKKCGTPFQQSQSSQVFCSKVCNRRFHSALEPWKSARARARHHGVRFEPGIKPVEIYERDNWRCALCHKKIPKDKKFPHPLSPSTDHTIPMCEGGDHVRENLRAAHLLCNSLKQNNVAGKGEQLMLFGT